MYKPTWWEFCASLLMLATLFQQCAGSQRFCGKALPEALDQICFNGYNTKIKKSMEWDDYTNNEVGVELPFTYAKWPFLAKVHGGEVNLKAKQRGRRHGVYDECCRKGCTYNELVSYCL
ncbi:probable insulin-like peptide 1 [Anastrepha ludens]|uniref:probable insulin-like peptide 1 n=1 Tax=Anastrepha ludens TaxID=28586 RepID=UPI0023B15791|nr:probable insulin-like peptide 1 [Anastrepha ludens]